MESCLSLAERMHKMIPKLGTCLLGCIYISMKQLYIYVPDVDSTLGAPFTTIDKLWFHRG